MLINYILMLILSIHLTTTESTNKTSITNPNTQNLQNSTSAPLAVPQSKENQHKFNENGEILLNRRIANTSNVSEPKNNQTIPITIVTEGSGVSKINKNDTTAIVIIGSEVNSKKILASTTTTTTAPSPTAGNSTQMKSNFNETMGNNSKIKTTVIPPTKASIVIVKSSTARTTTSTTTTSTTTTTTTTTPKPNKPTITFSVEDMPELAKVNADSSSSSNKFPSETKSSSRKLSVEEPDPPHVQPSQELDGGIYRNHRDYIIPIVSIIFAVPILMGMVIVAYRRFRDFWSTRHYRRMDFLVDGMYND